MLKLFKKLYISLYNKLWLRRLCKNNLVCGKKVCLAPGSQFSATKTTIGYYSWAAGPLNCLGYQNIQIGKFCAFGSNITIISTNHCTNKANMHIGLQMNCGFSSLIEESVPIVIGNSVWVGDNVTILPGVKVGDGVVIGAGSVVTRDVPDFAIVAGVPANVIRKRFSDDIINELISIRWWDWPIEKIKKHKAFFDTDLESITVEELRLKLNE